MRRIMLEIPPAGISLSSTDTFVCALQRAGLFISWLVGNPVLDTGIADTPITLRDPMKSFLFCLLAQKLKGRIAL